MPETLTIFRKTPLQKISAWIVMGCLVLGAAGGLIALRGFSAILERKIQGIDARVEQAEMEKRGLEAEMALLVSPLRVISEAKAMGMEEGPAGEESIRIRIPGEIPPLLADGAGDRRGGWAWDAERRDGVAKRQPGLLEIILGGGAEARE